MFTQLIRVFSHHLLVCIPNTVQNIVINNLSSVVVLTDRLILV